ncbi:MAG: hypothetical protein R3C02_08985 [Planctomycetaceae bacterium]
MSPRIRSFAEQLPRQERPHETTLPDEYLRNTIPFENAVAGVNEPLDETDLMFLSAQVW